ncbi:MAG TPA: NAD(P)/FAD-dependent oxidoreductase [Polyangia bacterium]|jgi:NADH dehydrogenase
MPEIPAPRAAPPHVVIVGGGFGGLYAARALRRAGVRITLVDRRNHHLFQPLLYQVATAALNPSDIATPIRRILRRQRNVEVVLAEATGIDVPGRRVILRDGALDYDYLILATGVTHSYFGHDAWEASAPGLKTIEDALEVRRRILLAYEAAERETDGERRREWLTFALVGGGPTGVELAGAIAEIARHVLQRDFRHIDPRVSRVLLLEAGPRILPSFAPVLSAKATRTLAGLGVEVRTGARVTGIDERGVTLGDERVAARTVLWAAGVEGSALARSLGVPLDRAGRVLVNPDLTLPGAPAVAVVGDLAALTQDGAPLPGVAPVAIQAGRHAAANIRRALRGQPLTPFRYADRGALATIGRAAAVAERGRVRLAGFLAWVLWLLVHIFWLIGFRNRFLVLSEWAWTYLRYERGARLITGAVPPLLGPGPEAAARPGGPGPGS